MSNNEIPVQLSLQIKEIALLIAGESQKQHPGETDLFSWNTFTVGKISPHKPFPAADLQTSYKNLYQLLSSPFTNDDRPIEPVSKNDSLTAIGFWRNANENITAVQLFVSGDIQKNITIQSEPTIARKLTIPSSPEIIQPTNDDLMVLAGVQDIARLTGTIIADQKFDAIFSVPDPN